MSKLETIYLMNVILYSEIDIVPQFMLISKSCLEACERVKTNPWGNPKSDEESLKILKKYFASIETLFIPNYLLAKIPNQLKSIGRIEFTNYHSIIQHYNVINSIPQELQSKIITPIGININDVHLQCTKLFIFVEQINDEFVRGIENFHLLKVVHIYCDTINIEQIDLLNKLSLKIKTCLFISNYTRIIPEILTNLSSHLIFCVPLNKFFTPLLPNRSFNCYDEMFADKEIFNEYDTLFAPFSIEINSPNDHLKIDLSDSKFITKLEINVVRTLIISAPIHVKEIWCTLKKVVINNWDDLKNLESIYTNVDIDIPESLEPKQTIILVGEQKHPFNIFKCWLSLFGIAVIHYCLALIALSMFSYGLFDFEKMYESILSPMNILLWLNLIFCFIFIVKYILNKYMFRYPSIVISYIVYQITPMIIFYTQRSIPTHSLLVFTSFSLLLKCTFGFNSQIFQYTQDNTKMIPYYLKRIFHSQIIYRYSLRYFTIFNSVKLYNKPVFLLTSIMYCISLFKSFMWSTGIYSFLIFGLIIYISIRTFTTFLRY